MFVFLGLRMDIKEYAELNAKFILLATSSNEEEKERLIKEIATFSNNTESCDEWERLLKFTKKEISTMPNYFKKLIRINKLRAYARKRKRGNSINYEIRCRHSGFDISASATTLEEAKAKFIEKLNNYTPQEDTNIIPKDFHEFSMYWFTNFHKRNVAEKTYDHNIKLYNRHIKERFKKFKLEAINAVMLQQFLDEFSNRGKTRKDLYSIIKQILDCAVKHGKIKLNPIGMCFLEDYDQEHGVALSNEEEHKLDITFKGTEWEIPLAVIRFTGLRPCEYLTAIIDGNFIKAQNGKRKDGKIEYKRIPINPMLAPYLEGITKLNMPKPRVINNRFKKVLPNHKLYDMRTTFQTRCTECGINETVIGLFMGNSIGKLKEAYTDLSDKFLLSEAKKFTY